MLKLFRVFALVALSLFVGPLFAQAQPVYTPPTNRVGGALASGIIQTLTRRGFAANDPRVVQTVQAIGARVVPLATAAGGGANWIALAGRLSPWVMGGILVYQGISWYFDSQGNVITRTPSSMPSSAEGLSFGEQCYYVLGDGSQFCGKLPEEAVVHYVTTTTVYTDLTLVSLIPDEVNSGAYQSGRRYSATIAGHRQGDPTTVWPALQAYFIYVGTATATCQSGYGVADGACTPSLLERYKPTMSNSSPNAPQIAYNILPQVAKDAALSDELAAEIANRIWRDAALQPDYSGVPWSATTPTVGSDFQPHRSAHPTDWPITSELNQTVPTEGTNPIVAPETNPNQITSPSGAHEVDPGIPAPTLEEPPADLFKPIHDALQPWLSWRVPTHASECPTWHAAPTISGRTFVIDIDRHCTFAEQYRSLIVAAALACWLAISVFIVLSA